MYLPTHRCFLPCLPLLCRWGVLGEHGPLCGLQLSSSHVSTRCPLSHLSLQGPPCRIKRLWKGTGFSDPALCHIPGSLYHHNSVLTLSFWDVPPPVLLTLPQSPFHRKGECAQTPGRDRGGVARSKNHCQDKISLSALQIFRKRYTLRNTEQCDSGTFVRARKC